MAASTHMATRTARKLYNGIVLLALVGLAVLSACSEDLEVPEEQRAETYYPLVEGLTRTYEVFDTTYTRFPVLDTLEAATFVRETVAGTVTDAEGRTVRRINRFSAPDLLGTFQPLAQWEAILAGGFVEQLADNIRTLVLRDPVELGSSWDGNAFNNLGAQTFRYLSVDTTLQRGGVTYSGCIYIEQRLVTNSLVDSVFTYEIYAPNIGLLERYDRQFRFILDPGGRELDVDNSYIHRRTLLPN